MKRVRSSRSSQENSRVILRRDQSTHANPQLREKFGKPDESARRKIYLVSDRAADNTALRKFD